MNLFGIGWSRAVTDGAAVTNEQRERVAIRRDWDDMRKKAVSDRERSEIDAIFSRYL